MIEQTFYGNKYEITYKFRTAKSDRRKLLVIFSGGFGSEKAYDFDGSSSNSVKSNILWIRDRFDGEFTYYIRDRRGFEVANDVQRLIQHFMLKLGLNKNDIILAGFSKGGTAALYHGIKYDYENIISTVPRIKIGTANLKRPHILNGLTDDQSEEYLVELDRLLPNIVAQDNQLGRNIYLYSSPADPLFPNELAEHIPLFEKYRNFNFVLTSSDLVRRHRDVTRYNLPNIISVMNLLMDGIAPHFGFVKNGNTDYRGVNFNSDTYGTHIHRNANVKIIDDHLFLKGHSFFKGIRPTDDSLSSVLCISGNDREHKFKLGHTTDPYLSYNYYDSRYINYDRGAYATIKNLGIKIADLSDGHYTLSILTNQYENEARANVQGTPGKISWGVGKENLYCLQVASDNAVHLNKKTISSPDTGISNELEVQMSLKSDRLKLDGKLAFLGKEYSPASRYYRYRLLLTDTFSGAAFLLPLKRHEVDSEFQFPSSKFAAKNIGFSMNRKLSSVRLPDGTYKGYIALLVNDKYVATDAVLELKKFGKDFDLKHLSSRRKGRTS